MNIQYGVMHFIIYAFAYKIRVCVAMYEHLIVISLCQFAKFL